MKALRAAYVIAFCSALFGCDKVPLRAHEGQFDLLAGHYFENEKTQYIFFSVSNLRPEQAKLSWPSRFALRVGAGAFTELDYSKAVHQHAMVACGEGKLCGSYSFKSETPPADLQIRYQHHPDARISVEQSIPNTVHPASDRADAQSAFVYGVFDGKNERVQIRIHDNFGTPNSEQLRQFGMTRKFEIGEIDLVELGPDSYADLRKKSGANFLFPATLCPELQSNEVGRSTEKVRVSSHQEGWWPKSVKKADEKGAACFKVSLLNREGQALREARALARKNPVLSIETASLESPLRSARTIPLILSYCPQRTDSDALVSPAFLDYQRKVLGAEGAPVDVCFAVGEEDRFAQELERVMSQKIENARKQNPDGSDFFFTVAINHRLPPVIIRFHEIIQQKLKQQVELERKAVSPRLVGAFIYDSQPLEHRKMAVDPGSVLVWCPRQENGLSASPTPADRAANSTPSSSEGSCLSYGFGGEVKIGPLNLMIPIGTFPTEPNFINYTTKHGTAGLSQNLRFAVQSVRTNANSVTLDQGSQQGMIATFFDGERVNISQGQGLKFCPERDGESVLSSLAFRGTGESANAETPFKGWQEVRDAFLKGESDLSYQVGIVWEHPFLGGISYDLPLTGKVFEFIPVSRSFSSKQLIGDLKWHRKTWRVGTLMQKCLRYCDHPVFDEAGVYQINQTWRTQVMSCREPKPVEAPQ